MQHVLNPAVVCRFCTQRSACVIYIYIYIYIYMYVSLSIYIYIYDRVYIYIYTHIHMNTYTCVYVYIYLSLSLYIYICIHTHPCRCVLYTTCYDTLWSIDDIFTVPQKGYAKRGSKKRLPSRVSKKGYF